MLWLLLVTVKLTFASSVTFSVISLLDKILITVGVGVGRSAGSDICPLKTKIAKPTKINTIIIKIINISCYFEDFL